MHIDADHADGVIRVRHIAANGVDILEATDKGSGTLTMRIDDSGTYRGNVVAGTIKVGVSETDVGIAIGSLNAATHAEADPGVDTLVRRSKVLGTQINNLFVQSRETDYVPAGDPPWPPAGLTFDQGQCTGGFDVLQDARVNFQPYDSNNDAILDRFFAFGRAVPEASETDITADARRDGLLMVDESTDQLVSLGISNELPTLRLMGNKTTEIQAGYTVPVCPVFDVRDTAGHVTYAVYDDGFVHQKGHHESDPDALNSGHFSSVVAGDESVYIGSIRLSYDRAQKMLRLRTLKESPPKYMQDRGFMGAPPGFTLASMTVHGWRAGSCTTGSRSTTSFRLRTTRSTGRRRACSQKQYSLPRSRRTAVPSRHSSS